MIGFCLIIQGFQAFSFEFSSFVVLNISLCLFEYHSEQRKMALKAPKKRCGTILSPFSKPMKTKNGTQRSLFAFLIPFFKFVMVLTSYNSAFEYQQWRFHGVPGANRDATQRQSHTSSFFCFPFSAGYDTILLGASTHYQTET